jgi:hypothetical protein
MSVKWKLNKHQIFQKWRHCITNSMLCNSHQKKVLNQWYFSSFLLFVPFTSPPIKHPYTPFPFSFCLFLTKPSLCSRQFVFSILGVSTKIPHSKTILYGTTISNTYGKTNQKIFEWNMDFGSFKFYWICVLLNEYATICLWGCKSKQKMTKKNQMNIKTRIPKLQVLQVCNWIYYNQNCLVNSEKYSWIL